MSRTSLNKIDILFPSSFTIFCANVYVEHTFFFFLSCVNIVDITNFVYRFACHLIRSSFMVTWIPFSFEKTQNLFGKYFIWFIRVCASVLWHEALISVANIERIKIHVIWGAERVEAKVKERQRTEKNSTKYRRKKWHRESNKNMQKKPHTVGKCTILLHSIEIETKCGRTVHRIEFLTCEVAECIHEHVYVCMCVCAGGMMQNE